jgi:hypothetical protein
MKRQPPLLGVKLDVDAGGWGFGMNNRGDKRFVRQGEMRTVTQGTQRKLG